MSSFLLGGCSGGGESTEVAATVEPVPMEPTVKTAGRVVFEGIPEEGVTAREVIVVESLDPAARERIRRQRQLFEYKIIGQNPELEQAQRLAELDLPPEKIREFDRSLAELRSSFPEALTQDVRIDEHGVDDDRVRKVSSDVKLHDDYEALFRAIRWDNMKRGIEFISAKLAEDGKAWSNRLAAESAYEAKQASVTLTWMDALAEHLNAYVALANDRILAHKAHAKQLHETSQKALTWEDYLARHANQLIIDTSSNELASAKLEKDGRFEIDARGKLLVRVEYATRSAYFLIGDSSENRVSVVEQKEWTEKPAP